MLRLLIVDDEATILDGLVELFHEVALPDLEINYAGSGLQALRTIEQNKIDIVLTDIRMPAMSGLELFDRIRTYYPRCKVIFLTGYSDFQYVQEVLRKGGVDYVLKMDGDEQIVESVKKAIASLYEHLDQERLIREAKDKMRRLLPIMHKELVQYLILGEPYSEEALAQRFVDLNIPLKANLPVLMVVGKADSWDDTLKPSERALLSFAIQNIMEEFMPSSLTSLAILLDSSFHVLWLIQPNPDLPDTAERTSDPSDDSQPTIEHLLHCLLESSQQAAHNFLKLPLSFAASDWVSWTDLGKVYGHLNEMSYRSAGIGMEIAFLHAHREADQEADRQMDDELRMKLRRFVILESHLENSRESEFKKELQSLLHSVHNNLTSLPLRLEVFQRISNLFLSYINRVQYNSVHTDAKAMEYLTRFDLHPSWEHLTDYFLRLTDDLFTHRQKTQTDRGLEIVVQINGYIERNLSNDLSLGRLARVVYLNPAYLSRLYKQVSGIGLSDFVTEKRMATAKEILRSTDMKIQDIASAVGLDSPSYFARLFKRMTSMSPQEYREAIL
jgi:two-component system response regulator YesN